MVAKEIIRRRYSRVVTVDVVHEQDDRKTWLDGPTEVPRKGGVYVLYLDHQFPRLRGRSDILLIGKTSAQGGLRKRIRTLLGGSGSHVARDRVARLIELRFRLILAWEECENPEQREGRLLRRYVKEHLELPPLNRNLPSAKGK